MFNFLLICKYVSQAYEILSVCLDKPESTGISPNNVKVVDVTEGTLVHLYCNYCNTTQHDSEIKVWFYKKRGEKINKQIPVTTSTTDNKISLSKHLYTLNIFFLSRNDSGIYICKSTKSDNVTFSYILDDSFKELVEPRTGTEKLWKQFKSYQIRRLNKKFKISQEEPFVSLRNSYKLLFQIVIIWESWGPCMPKSNGNLKGIHRRIGKCRLRPRSMDNPKILGLPLRMDNVYSYYVMDNYDISCKSKKLNETFPSISKLIRQIPNFEVKASCIVKNYSASVGEDSDVTEKVLVHIAENGHSTLTCTDGGISSKIKWFKYSNPLNDSFRNNMAGKKEPHLTIDNYNTLYILCATKNEEGNYTCTLNGIILREFAVKVVSMAKILNQDFIRYSMYLGFILSLTVTCYCAGLCVAWHRRSSFADPLNLQYNYKSKVSKNRSGENEILLKEINNE